MKRILTLLALIIGFVFQGYSQVLLNQCESLTPCNARAICGTTTINTSFTFTTTSTTAGYNTPCAGGTPVITNAYSTTPDWVYYRFTCYASGNFNFRLSPNDSATTASDLDWQLFNITTSGCATIGAANLLKCNASNSNAANPSTGIQAIPNAYYESTISITAGSTYILGISNNSGVAGSGGFNLSFGGTTASLTDNKKPFMASLIPFDPCSPVSSIKIKLSEPVRCALPNLSPSVLGVGIDFAFAPATPVFSTAPTGCPNCLNAAPNANPGYFGNATDTATITFATALAPGTYTITALANQWTDMCGNTDSTQKTLVFTVPAPFKDSVRTGFDCVLDKYIDTVYGVNGLSPYIYSATGGCLSAAVGAPTAPTATYKVYTNVCGGTPVTYTIQDAGGCLTDTTISHPAVSNLGAPALNTSASPPCHDQFSLDSINVSFITGGLPPYTFTIASAPASALTLGPATNPSAGKWKNLQFSAGATFTVTVTDALGCTNIGVKNLVNPTTLVFPTPTVTPPPCGGDSTGSICFPNATTGTPGSPPNLYTYTITPSYSNTVLNTTPTNCFANLPSGTYTLTVTDGNGCIGTVVRTLSATPTFSINPLSPKVSPSCPSNCDGRFTPIPIAGLGTKKYYLYPYVGPGPWDYSDSVVSTIAPNNDFDSLCVGTYTIIARDAVGCTTSSTFTLNYPISPVLTVTTLNPPLCFGGVGTITVQTTFITGTYASSQYTYMPSPTAGMSVAAFGASGSFATYSGVPAGMYDLIVTNVNQCADTLFGVVMTQPTAPVTYSSVTVDSVTCFGLSNGVITVQATGGTSGANTYQYAIKVGAGPFSAFSPATLAPMVYNRPAGVYTIRVRDQNGCLLDTVVTVHQPSQLNLLLDHTVSTCFGTSAGEICVVDTGATPDYEYKLGALGAWSTPQTPGFVYCFNNLTAGNYTVFTRDANGCLDNLVVNVASIPLPIVSFTASPNDTVCEGTAVTLCGTGADTYSWAGVPPITDCNAFTPSLGLTTYAVIGTNTTTGCINNAVANVLVNPIPVLSPINDQIVCNGVTTASVSFTSSVGGTTFSWTHDATAAIGIGTSGTVNIPAFTAVNTSNAPLIVTFTVTPTGPNTTNCVGANETFTITVNPTPTLTDPNDTTLCADEFTNAVVFVGPVAGTNYSWTNSNPSIGLATPGGGSNIPSFQALNAGNVPNIGVITVTPLASGCPGPTQVFTITVNPIPVVTVPPNQAFCNGTGTAIFNFTSNVAATTFAWTNSDPSIGLAASGIGSSIPSFTGINNGNVPIIATICVTPSGPIPTNCLGATECFTITINPTPVISSSADQELCAGDFTNLISFNSNVAGSVFDWTNSQAVPLVGIGLAAAGINNINSFVAVNTTSAPLTGIIIVTPSASSCPGISDTLNITVNPLPQVDAVDDQTVCESEMTVDIVFSSNIVGATFDWVCNVGGIGLPGTSGTGDILSFATINVGTTPIVATFTVTAVGPAPTNCIGSDTTFTITILPRDNASFSYVPSTVCITGSNPTPLYIPATTLGGTFSYTGGPGTLSLNTTTGIVNLAASSLGAYVVTYITTGTCPDTSTFNLTLTVAPCATFSYAAANYCQSGTDPSPTFATNCSAGTFSALPAGLSVDPSTGDIDVSASNAGTFTVTNFIPAAGGCAAATATTLVTIDSATVMTDPADLVYCVGNAVPAIIFGGSVAGTNYAWTNSNTAIGIGASGVGNVPAFTASNATTAPIVATFTVTPTGPTGCTGVPETFTITVNPNATLTLTSAPGTPTQTVCINTAINNITYIIGGSATNATIAFTPAVGSGLTGVFGAGTVTIIGTPIISGTITYTVTATGPCASATSTGTITVNPDAILTLTSAPGTVAQIVCEGTPITNIVYAVTGTGNAASITWNPPSGPGLTNSYNAATDIYTVSGASNAPGIYTYTVTATGTCGSSALSGSLEITPLQDPTFTYPNPTNCQSGTTAPNFIATPGGAFSATPAGLVFAPLPAPNGTINLAASAVGSYTIKYVTPGPCPDSTTITSFAVVTIPCADFSYAAATYCQSAPNATPLHPSGCTNGAYSSIPAGVSFVSTSTGVINFAASTPGVYQIINTIVASGVCPMVDDTFSITITAKPTLSLVTSTNAGCNPNCNGTATTSVVGGTPGYTYSIAPSGSVNGVGLASGLCAGTIYTITVSDATLCTGTLTVTVGTTPSPTITIVSTTNAGCNPNCNGTATTNVAGGSGAPFSYSILPLGGGPSSINAAGVASGLCAGTVYTIAVADAAGCTGTTTVSIGTTPSPTLSGIVLCTTTPTALDGKYIANGAGGTLGYVYSISPFYAQAPLGTFIGIGAGVVFTVTVTDSKGCTATVVDSMCAPGSLICTEVLSAHVNVNCFGASTGAFKDSIYGGTGPYTFVSLLDASSNPVPFSPAVPTNVITASGLPAGTYTASWLDSNNVPCNALIVITQPAQLIFVAPVINTPTCTPGCDGTLSISASGGTGTKIYQITAPAGMTCVATQPTPGNFGGLGVGTYTVQVTDANFCTATTAVTINASPLPTLSLAGTNPTCNNICDGIILCTPGSGTPPYGFGIQSPVGSPCTPTQATSGNFTTLSGGTYTIVVTDSKGCNVSATTNLVIPPAIVIDTLTNTNVLCNGNCNGTIHMHAIGGTGPLDYTMTPPIGLPVNNTTGNFTALCAGTYTVSANDANCSVSATVVITQPSTLAWAIATSSNITCAGTTTGIINTLASGGVPVINYSLNGGAYTTTSNFTALAAGTYTVVARDANACTIVTTFNIVEPPLLVLGAPVVVNVKCNGGSDGSITISASGGTPGATGYTYNIVPVVAIPNTTGVFTNIPFGTYAITVTDSAGCTKTYSSIIVGQPAPLVFTLTNKNDVACFGDATGTITVNTQGGTPAVSYSISPNVGTQAPAGFFQSLTAGTYVVTATDINGCATSTAITVLQGPQIILVNFTMTEVVCNGDATGAISFTVIGGTGQLKYQLDGGTLQTDTFFNNLPAGNHVLTVVDALGCKFNQIITVKEPDPLGATFVLTASNCIDSKDGKALITGTGGRGGYKYYLTPGLHINKSGIFVGLAPGTYVLRVVDTAGCEYKTNITIDLPSNPLANTITKVDLACNGVGNEGTATANVSGGEPPYTYLWNTVPAQTTANASTLYYGLYSVLVIDANGCVIKDSVYIEEGPCCDVSFIPNAFSPNGDQNNDEFRVLTTAGVILLQLEIYNRWGKRVWSTGDYRRGWDGLIDGKEAAIDTYYYIFRYKCTRDDKTYTRKGDVILIR